MEYSDMVWPSDLLPFLFDDANFFISLKSISLCFSTQISCFLKIIFRNIKTTRECIAPQVGEVVFEVGDEDNNDNHGNHDNHDMIRIQVHGSANLGESC